ncbi:MAG: NADH-quinone oxidoreductase subunit NuoE [Desulfobacteraceae bacterium]|uniref:NADH-quinone oxidoreductase subunit NuoE n=1 Tax=Candidatus Desulfacyla euxinica TaxID=2841693 RepID=A0A8J6T9A0_9DELT|nr:NADH-quinone oxidoreductase subunit NuoE [Candidatus Desulfacyla euxinica]MBL6977921.1 NADH-quinone oxidoreductase subunit NuoE [Desulfobacteraceae bacterium]
MERDQLLGMIKEEQAKNGSVSDGAMAHIAQTLHLPIGNVYGVTTFYSFLSTRPLGRHVIHICKSVPCFLQNGAMMAAAIEKELGISPGETTSDGRFSFELTNCIGACDQAPAMLVDDEVYGDLTPEKIGEILKSFE